MKVAKSKVESSQATNVAVEDAPTTLPSERGQQRVSIHYGKDRKKMLSVELWDNANAKPDFKFEGFWTGKDIKVIQRSLTRAYAQYTVDLRRAKVGTTPDNHKEGAN